MKENKKLPAMPLRIPQAELESYLWGAATLLRGYSEAVIFFRKFTHRKVFSCGLKYIIPIFIFFLTYIAINDTYNIL